MQGTVVMERMVENSSICFVIIPRAYDAYTIRVAEGKAPRPSEELSTKRHYSEAHEC